jgi:hypothetical protein
LANFNFVGKLTNDIVLGNDANKMLPLTRDLTMLHYTGYHEDDELQGLIMMYKDFKAVYVLEQVFDRKSEIKSKQRQSFEDLR